MQLGQVWGIGVVRFALATYAPDPEGAVAKAAALMRSDDAGATWTVVRRYDSAYYNEPTLLGGDGSGLVLVGGLSRMGMGRWPWLDRSVDGGRTWTAAVFEEQADATGGCSWNVVWVGRDGKAAMFGSAPACAVQHSTDRGATWTVPRSMPEGMRAGIERAWGTEAGEVHATGPGGAFYSADGGASWRAVSPGD
jgi:hypothetical protein